MHYISCLLSADEGCMTTGYDFPVPQPSREHAENMVSNKLHWTETRQFTMLGLVPGSKPMLQQTQQLPEVPIVQVPQPFPCSEQQPIKLTTLCLVYE